MSDRCAVDAYVVDTLMPDLVGHDRRPSAFLVYLYLWRQTDGGTPPSGPRSLATVAELTGLSKRSVQAAVATLEKRGLVRVRRTSATAVPVTSISG